MRRDTYHIVFQTQDADRSVAGADRRRRAVEIRRRLLLFRVIAYVDIALEVRLAVEIERIPQIVERRHVGRHVDIALLHLWVRKIVAAAVRERLKLPVALDELQQRDMVGVAVIDSAARRIGRVNDQRNAGAVAKVVDWLLEYRAIIAATYVQCDEAGSFS